MANILTACEESGRVRDALRKRGYNAYSCDIMPSRTPSPYHIQDDVLNHLTGWDMIIGFPPCTRLCNSGVRWLREPPPGKTIEQIWAEFYEAVAFYNALMNAPCDRIALENPAMNPYARELIPGADSRHFIQLYEFGHLETKRTGFQLKGIPPLKPTSNLKAETMALPYAERAKVHSASPGPYRARDRSETRQGVAEAMAEQWGPLA